ncbi:hypothetical protein FACS189460_0850 [Deltaproteobacteria bacterium]|nr:hypothetical protein FACS189460_0850 [Deltaproteobacteria bacterium]
MFGRAVIFSAGVVVALICKTKLDEFRFRAKELRSWLEWAEMTTASFTPQPQYDPFATSFAPYYEPVEPDADF